MTPGQTNGGKKGGTRRRPWIFVVGAPRSGTSLLRRLLSSHGRLYISPELRILELIKIAGVLAAPGNRARQVPMGMAYGRLLARHQLQHTNSVRYGDKYPPYCTDIPELSKLFPDAQFVHIIRDGRDVVSSLARTRAANRGWRRGPDIPAIDELVNDWVSFVHAARQGGAALEAGRYHELRYEHLLADPIPTLRATLRFLGEDIDAETIAGIGEIRTGRSWRQTLSPAEWLSFHRTPLAVALLHQLGYPPTPLPEDRVDTTPPAEGVAERIASGGDDPHDWAELGRAAAAAGQSREAVAALTRAVRGPVCVEQAALDLLADPSVPESVFAALNMIDAPSAAPALVDWAVGRGLDRAAAAALFSSSPDEEVA